MRDLCKWCGVIHDRGANTHCPLTIAETKLAAVAEVERIVDKIRWSCHHAIERDNINELLDMFDEESGELKAVAGLKI